MFYMSKLVQSDFFLQVRFNFHFWSFSLPVDNNQCYRFKIRDTARLGDLHGTNNDYSVKINGEPVEWNADSSEVIESITFPAEKCDKISACGITT